MEYRRKTASKIYKHLEDRVNCTNILEFMRTHTSDSRDSRDSRESSELTIESISVTSEIIKYTDNDSASSSEVLSKSKLNKIYDRYDFISEANHTGFEYFPYLYGVLDCHSGMDSKVYVIYEMFDGTLDTMLSEIEHASDWYETIFQICLIHHYIINIAKASYSGATVPHHLYQKYKFAKKRQYTLGEFKFELYHKNLVVLWDFQLETPSSNSPPNLKHLLDYITTNGSKFKIQPSPRLIRMLNEIISTPADIPKILDSYYNTKKETPLGVPFGKTI